MAPSPVQNSVPIHRLSNADMRDTESSRTRCQSGDQLQSKKRDCDECHSPNAMLGMPITCENHSW